MPLYPNGTIPDGSVTQLKFAAGATGFSSSVVSKTTTYAATSADDVILCSGSAFTVTLPAASGGAKRLTLKKTDSTAANIITIARAGSDTITDNAASLTSTTLNTIGETLVLVSDGTSVWQVLSRSYPSVWTAYTPTFVGLGTVTQGSAYWRRVGDSIQVVASCTTGTCTAVQASVSLPNSWLTNSAKVTTIITSAVGSMAQARVSTDQITILCAASDSNTMLFGNSAAAGGTLGAVNGNGVTNNSTSISLTFQVPISGWN